MKNLVDLPNYKLLKEEFLKPNSFGTKERIALLDIITKLMLECFALGLATTKEYYKKK